MTEDEQVLSEIGLRISIHRMQTHLNSCENFLLTDGLVLFVLKFWQLSEKIKQVFLIRDPRSVAKY